MHALIGSRTTAMISLLDTRSATPPARTPQNISLSSLVESVLSSLEEPRGKYHNYRVSCQLIHDFNRIICRVESTGGTAFKAPDCF